MNAAKQLYRHRIAAWIGSVSLALVSVYILFGGHPAINQQSAHERLKQLSQALAEREELGEFRPSIGHLDVQITGWGYDRQAIISKPKLAWNYSKNDWRIEAQRATLKPDKINPKRFVMRIAGPLQIKKNDAVFVVITSTDEFIYTYSDTGKDSLQAINHQFILPKEMTIDFSDTGQSDLAVKSANGESFLKLGLMPNIGKMTMSATIREMELYQKTKQEPYGVDFLQLNLLENRSSDHSRLGHVTLSARLKPGGQAKMSEVEGAAEYKADRLYSHTDMTIQKLYAKHPQGDVSLGGNVQFKKNNKTTGQLELLPSKKIITEDSIRSIIDMFQTTESKDQQL